MAHPMYGKFWTWVKSHKFLSAILVLPAIFVFFMVAALFASLVLVLTGNGASDEPTTTARQAAPTPSKATQTPTPTPTRAPSPSPTKKTAPKALVKTVKTYTVTHVVDGDTVDLSNGETVRVVGIDTPERGQCGYTEATDNMVRLVLNKRVSLGKSDEDRDRYGRLLRYVDVGKMDAGLRQIKSGHAIARYDSRDGYGRHPREDRYIKADQNSPNFKCDEPKPTKKPSVAAPSDDCMDGYSPCLPVTNDLDCSDVGGPVTVTGDDPYGLDRDGDGVGCDS